MQEEITLAARSRIHGTQHEESQALTSHVKKGMGKGRKFHGKKGKGGISTPTSDQKKKKVLSHVHCKHEASTADVEEDTSQKKPKNRIVRSSFSKHSRC